MSSALTPPSYNSLREQVAQILTAGRGHSRQASEWERVDTYWRVGDAINVYILGGAKRAEYGQKTISNLSKDLELGKSLLHDIVRFRKAFPIFHARRQLGWKHYCILLGVPSVEHRRFYERQADEAVWSTRELRRQIQANLYLHTRDAPEALAAGEDPFDGRPFRSRRGKAGLLPAMFENQMNRVPVDRSDRQGVFHGISHLSNGCGFQ